MKLWPLWRKSAPPLASPDAFLRELFGAIPGPSGVTVNADTAMRVPAVRAAVGAIAEAIGQLPVHLYDRASRERVADHPLYALLHDRANEAIGAGEFREQLTRDALLTGNAYALVVRVGDQPRELLRLAPSAVHVEADDYGLPTYLLAGTPDRIVPRRDIIHLRGPGLSGVKGDSPVQQAREAIALAIMLEEHASRLFGNGARPAGVVEVPADVPAEALTALKTAWQATHEGREQAGKTAWLLNGAKFNPMTFSSVDAQFLELRQFALTEIARIWRVPPVFIQDYGRATWSNSAEMGQQFLTYCLMPWIKRWESEINLKLAGDYYAEFQVDGLLRADFTTRMAGYATAIAARILSPNEARAAENRPPYPGGDTFENPNTTAAPAGQESNEP